MGWSRKRTIGARWSIGTACAALLMLFGCAVEPLDTSDDFAQISQAVGPPIEVSTLAQLRAMTGSNSYVLKNNINASATSTTPFVPVGTSAAPFKGSFDGKTFTISNLNIAGNGHNAGMFGYVSGANIANVKLTNVQLTNNANHTGAIVGYLVGSNLTDCQVSGSITGLSSTGGLIGTANNSYLVGLKATNLTVNGSSYAGGIAGRVISGSYLINSQSAGGSVTGTSNTGGLVGRATDSGISYSSATNLNVDGTTYTGGVAGYVTGGNLTYVSAAGSIDAQSQTGGLVGYHLRGDIIHNSASVTVTGTNDTGGLVGLAQSASVLFSSVSGTITGTSNTGGIIGRMYGSSSRRAIMEGSYIDNAPNNAQSVVTGGTPVGMAVGLAESYVTLTRSYALGRVTGLTNKIGGFVGEIKAYWPNSAQGTPTADLFELFTNVQVDPIFGGGSAPVYAGGLAGYVLHARIIDANITGSVIGRGYVGGALGYVKNTGTDVVDSIMRSVLSRGVVTNVTTSNRSGLIGGVDVNMVTCYTNYWDTDSDGGTAPPLPPGYDPNCQKGLSSAQLKAPDGAYVSYWLPHGDYRIFTYGMYIDAAFEAAYGDRPYCEHGGGSDGDFGFGFCGAAPVWHINSSSEYNTLVNIPNPSRQSKI